MIAVLTVSKFEEIQHICGVTEEKMNILSSNETVANVGDISIILAGF